MSQKSAILPGFFLVCLVILLTACSASQSESSPTIADENLTTQPSGAAQLPYPYPAPATSQPMSSDQGMAYPAPVGSSSANAVRFSIIPGDTQATYEVGETFLNQGNVFNLAIGVTPQVSGDIYIDYTNPQNSAIGTITVNISQLTSDSSRRDDRIRSSWLESATYPLATFTPTLIDGLPAVGAENVDYPLRITGDLTVRQVTRSVTFDATVRLSGNTLTGTATTTILLSDFGVGPISIAGILETQDEAKLTLNLVARRN
jgi:polyisoprenoid-binding protein YceI